MRIQGLPEREALLRDVVSRCSLRYYDGGMGRSFRLYVWLMSCFAGDRIASLSRRVRCGIVSSDAAMRWWSLRTAAERSVISARQRDAVIIHFCASNDFIHSESTRRVRRTVFAMSDLFFQIADGCKIAATEMFLSILLFSCFAVLTKLDASHAFMTFVAAYCK